MENQSKENTYANVDGLGELMVPCALLVLALWLVGVLCSIGAIRTHYIKKNGDIYTINAEYTRSYVDEKFRIWDIYKTEKNDAEIQYIAKSAGADSAEPVFGENTTFTIYKYNSDTLCYVGEKRINGYNFLSDDMFLLLTEGKRTSR